MSQTHQQEYQQIFDKVSTNTQLNRSQLITKAIELNQARFTHFGALTMNTGKHTGRAAKDKYVVDGSSLEHSLDKTGYNSITEENFAQLRFNVMNSLSQKNNLFHQKKQAGAHDKYAVTVNLFTPSAPHALFFQNMFRELSPNRHSSIFKAEWTILHHPTELATNFSFLKSPTAVVINFDQQEILIVGTAYAGEIKKSIFSILNCLLPQQQVFPMHAGANIDELGTASVFFGLSGTGKTTLSTDVGRMMVGDDELGLCADGLFNFEGGCYAKTYKLQRESEPSIYQATEKFGTLLENVLINEDTMIPNFDDKSITENGRASYCLSSLPEVSQLSVAPTPKHFFFLSADASGLLPPIAKLNEQQAIFYFLSGFTSKLAGTEMGVTTPQMAFSQCFGAPFMMLKAEIYAELLQHYLTQNKIHVWLVNTGWGPGGYGLSDRYPINVTRGLIRWAQGLSDSECDSFSARSEAATIPVFNLQVPTKTHDETINNTLKNYMNWIQKNEQLPHLQKLATSFLENSTKWKSSHLSKNTDLGAPSIHS